VRAVLNHIVRITLPALRHHKITTIEALRAKAVSTFILNRVTMVTPIITPIKIIALSTKTHHLGLSAMIVNAGNAATIVAGILAYPNTATMAIPPGAMTDMVDIEFSFSLYGIRTSRMMKLLYKFFVLCFCGNLF
jgi:hypothetical protein